jgi:Uma2 family endonuclease
VIKAALNEIIARGKPQDLRLGIETTLYLSDRTFAEPDLCLYPKRLLPEDVRGTDVLLAIEVSGSSLGYDRGLKARLYARYAIQELWVIDAAKRVTWVHREPRSDGTWESVEKKSAEAELTTPSLPGINIVLSGLE